MDLAADRRRLVMTLAINGVCALIALGAGIGGLDNAGPDIAADKRRLVITLAINGICALIALGAGIGGLVYGVDWLNWLFGAALIVGFIACLVGVLVVIWARSRPETPPWALWVGIAVVALGWACFAYSIFKRTAWVRSHPFDPSA